MVHAERGAQGAGVLAGHPGVEPGGHVDREDTIRSERDAEHTGHDTRVDAAAHADEVAVVVPAHVVEVPEPGHDRVVDRLDLGLGGGSVGSSPHASGRSPAGRCRFRARRCRFRVGRCRFRVGRCRFRADRCRFRADRCRFRTDRCRLRAGCRIAGYRSRRLRPRIARRVPAAPRARAAPGRRWSRRCDIRTYRRRTPECSCRCSVPPPCSRRKTAPASAPSPRAPRGCACRSSARSTATRTG